MTGVQTCALPIFPSNFISTYSIKSLEGQISAHQARSIAGDSGEQLRRSELRADENKILHSLDNLLDMTRDPERRSWAVALLGQALENSLSPALKEKVMEALRESASKDSDASVRRDAQKVLSGRYTLIYTRVDGKWLVVFQENSPDPIPSPSAKTSSVTGNQ